MVIGEKAEYRFYAVASFQAAGGTAIGVGWNLGIMLSVSSQTHNVIPIEVPQLPQVIPVKTGIVSKDGMHIVCGKLGY